MKNKKYIHKALTDLLHIQRKSFNTFLNSGFIEEFEKYFFTKDPNSTAYSNVFCITPFFTSDSFVEGVCFSSNCFGPVVAPSVAKHEQRIMETNATGRSFTRSFTRSYTRSACNIPSVCNTTWETSCETTSFFQIRNKPSNTKGINIGYFEIYLYPQYYLLTKPTFSEEYCLLLGKDYSSKIYIPILLIDSKTKRISYQYLYMGSLPLMTKHGFFITNGISRVIVNQIIRSPNVYFYKQSLKKLFFNKKGNKGNTDSTTHRNKSILGISGTSYYADIIPDRGTWLRLLFDKNGLLWACTKKLPKIPLLTFLLMFGLSLKQISSSIDIKYLFNGLSLRSNGVAQQLPKIALDPVCWDAFHRFIFTNTMNSLCEAKTSSNIVSKKLIFNTFVNAKYNGLGLNGRFALDTKLYLSFASVPFGPLSVCSIRTPSRLLVAFENKQRSLLSEGCNLFASQKTSKSQAKVQKQSNKTTLTAQDFVSITNLLIKVIKGNQKIDNIDDFKNKRIRTTGELISIAVNEGLDFLYKSLYKTKYRFAFASDVFCEANRLHPSDPVAFFATHETTQMPSEPFEEQEPLSQSDNTKQSNSHTLLGFAIMNNSYRCYSKDPKDVIHSLRSNDVIHQKQAKEVINNAKLKGSLNGSLKQFFGTSALSQFLDETNPLTSVTHKRRLTLLGPNGVSRDNATLSIRSIHPTHYGRICPIETPEGKNAGLVNSITTYGIINSFGHIESSYYKIYKGSIRKRLGFYNISPYYDDFTTYASNDIYSSILSLLPVNNIPVRSFGNESILFFNRSKTPFIGISPISMIAIGSSLIPFIEHDDASRALMGSNMQRQALPLIKPQAPIVGTGLEGTVAYDSGHILSSRKSGFITYVSSEKVSICCGSLRSLLNNGVTNQRSNEHALSLRLAFVQKQQQKQQQRKTGCKASTYKSVLLRCSCSEGAKAPKAFAFEGLLFSKTESLLHKKQSKNQSQQQPLLFASQRNNKTSILNHKIQSFNRTNQNTLINQRAFINENKWVQQCDLLADGSFSSLGELSVGQNILVGYLPWEGFNYEDAVLINKRLVYDDVFTTIHVEKFNVVLPEYDDCSSLLVFCEANRLHPSDPVALCCSKKATQKNSNDVLLPDLCLSKRVCLRSKQQGVRMEQKRRILQSGWMRSKGFPSLLWFENKDNRFISEANKPAQATTKQQDVRHYVIAVVDGVKAIVKQKQMPLSLCDNNNQVFLCEAKDVSRPSCLLRKQKEVLQSKNINETSGWKSFLSRNKKAYYSFLDYNEVYGCCCWATPLRSNDVILQSEVKTQHSKTFHRGCNTTTMNSFCVIGNASFKNVTTNNAMSGDDFCCSFAEQQDPKDVICLLRKKQAMAVVDGVKAGGLKKTKQFEGFLGLKKTKQRSNNQPKQMPSEPFEEQEPLSQSDNNNHYDNDYSNDHKQGYHDSDNDYKELMKLLKIYNNGIYMDQNFNYFNKNTNKKYLKGLVSVGTYINENDVLIYPKILNIFDSSFFNKNFNGCCCSFALLSSNSKEQQDPKDVILHPNSLRSNDVIHHVLLPEQKRRIHQKQANASDLKKTGAFALQKKQKQVVYKLSPKDSNNKNHVIQQNLNKKGIKVPSLFLESKVCAPYRVSGTILSINVAVESMQNDIVVVNEVNDDVVDLSLLLRSKEANTFRRTGAFARASQPKDPKGFFKTAFARAFEQKQPKGVAFAPKEQQQQQQQQQQKVSYYYLAANKPTFTIKELISLNNLRKGQKLEAEFVIAEKRKIKVGDKISGRHGNKGIISLILGRGDMPYLPDGSPLDIVLNPLGVPSRMNVGQLFECLLGLSGKILKENYRIIPFDELYGAESSRSFVYWKLFVGSRSDRGVKGNLSLLLRSKGFLRTTNQSNDKPSLLQSKHDVLLSEGSLFSNHRNEGSEGCNLFASQKTSNGSFASIRFEESKHPINPINPTTPGKTTLYDGRSGEPFHQRITVGYSYILRLYHMVDDKLNSRNVGPYSLITQQPLRGKSKRGGQRLGEMEMWAFEGYGSAYSLLENLTIKSDDLKGRAFLWENLINLSYVSFNNVHLPEQKRRIQQNSSYNKQIQILSNEHNFEALNVITNELRALCIDLNFH